MNTIRAHKSGKEPNYTISGRLSRQTDENLVNKSGVIIVNGDAMNEKRRSQSISNASLAREEAFYE